MMLCRVLFHRWNRWKKRPDENAQWRVCRRCGLIEERSVKPRPEREKKVLAFPRV